MEKLIRSSYKEAGLYGANAITFEYRSKTIERILKDKEFSKEEYKEIACWLMGSTSEEIEDHIVEIEKNFCIEDKDFSIKDKKEMQVLCSILLLEYCKKNTDEIIPLIILCGNGIGKKLPCLSLYNQFQDMIEDLRLTSREIEELQYQIKPIGLKAFKSSVAESRKDLSEEEYEYSTQQLDKLVNIIELQDENIKTLDKSNKVLRQQVSCQREESDVLWWMINEWSDTYKKGFSDLTAEELAIAIAIELNQKSQYALFPYSVERIISSLFQKYDDRLEKKSLSDYMAKRDDSIIDLLDIEEDDFEIVQPILEAFCCMKNCGLEKSAWNGMLLKKYGNNADDISMSPIDFAKHFCLELELMNSF